MHISSTSTGYMHYGVLDKHSNLYLSVDSLFVFIIIIRTMNKSVKLILTTEKIMYFARYYENYLITNTLSFLSKLHDVHLFFLFNTTLVVRTHRRFPRVLY